GLARSDGPQIARRAAGAGLPRPAGEAGRLLDLEPLLLEVELALDAAHHVGTDPPLVAEPYQLGALRGVDLVHEPLIGERALLDAVRVRAVELAGPGREAPLPESVESTDPLERLIARPLLSL